jgi:hypothetical protein
MLSSHSPWNDPSLPLLAEQVDATAKMAVINNVIAFIRLSCAMSNSTRDELLRRSRSRGPERTRTSNFQTCEEAGCLKIGMLYNSEQ